MDHTDGNTNDIDATGLSWRTTGQQPRRSKAKSHDPKYARKTLVRARAVPWPRAAITDEAFAQWFALVRIPTEYHARVLRFARSYYAFASSFDEVVDLRRMLQNLDRCHAKPARQLELLLTYESLGRDCEARLARLASKP